MDGFGVDEYSGDLLDIVAYAEMYDSTELRDRFSDRVQAWVEKVNNDHGVVFTEETPLEPMITSLRTLELLQAWLDHSDVMRTLETDETNEEIYAELVQLTTGAVSDNFLPFIESVDVGLLRSIRKLHEDKEDEDINTVVASEDQLNRLKQAMGFIGSDTLANRILKIGYPLGAPIAFYTNLLKKQMEYLPSDQLAKELFVVLHMGKDTYSDIITGFSLISDRLLEDLQRISDVDRGIKHLTSKFTGYCLANPVK